VTLSNKTVLVTGASRGIGAAICRRLAADGARIIAVARSQDQLDALLREIKKHRDDCIAIAADLANPDAITKLVAAVRDQAGKLDILINNAGIAWMRPFEDITLDDWRQLMTLNMDAVFLLTRDFLPMLRESGGARIINIGSNACVKGIAKMSCYCASKFALRGFTMALREELADSGIRVNLVMPGPVNTTIAGEKADQWHLLQPEDIAEIVWQITTVSKTADVWETRIEPAQ